MSKPIPPPYKPPAAAPKPAAAAPAATSSKPKPPPYKSTVQPVPPPVPAKVVQPAVTPAGVQAPAMTGEALMQRLRYFENLAVQHEGYIETLKATITRQGGAVPVAYFAPLKGEGGSHTPKSG